MKEIWLKVEISTLKSEKENLMRTLEESAEEIREQDTKWQKLKDFIKTYQEDVVWKNKQVDEFQEEILDKMQELEGEDE